MKNRTAAKILFCAIITITCFNGCGSGNKSQQKADTSTETLEVSDLETKEDSLNLPDSTPAVSRDSRLVNTDGEAWIFHSCGSSGVCHQYGIIFHANGKFDYIETGGYFEEENYKWSITKTGTWHTENNKILRTISNGQATIVPYTITTLHNARALDELVFDTGSLTYDYDQTAYFEFYYFRENINMR